MTLLAVVAIMALVVAAGSLLYAARAISRKVLLPNPVQTEYPQSDILMAIEKLELDLERLTLAVSDGIARNDRAEKRIQKTVTSARRFVRESGLEHAGIEAEYEELHEGDGEPSPSGEVRPVPQEVARVAPVGIPGVSPQELARLQEAMNVTTE